jgi:hypothetical protein
MIKNFILVILLVSITGIIAAKERKPALIVLTDIGGDPDDTQSLRRLLVYSNEFNILGLIATSDNIPRPGYKHQINTNLILHAIDDYSKVRDNLLLHDPDYPTSESLRAIVRGGQVNRGAENLAPGKATPGSQHIIEAVDANREPIFITIWGGAHDLAQALLDIKSTRSPKEIQKFIRKIRIYAISDQDAIGNLYSGTGEWIRINFPDLWYVEPGSKSVHSMTASFRGMYQNDSKGGDHPELPLVKPGIEILNQQEWILENVNTWGPIGEGYPAEVHQNPGSDRNKKGVKEGDTPSWFYVYPHGLNNPDFPEWGGWGGRFIRKNINYFIEANDIHWSGSEDAAITQKWTVARWREAYQNDFAARMRWCKLPFDEANHNPVAVIGKDKSSDILFQKVKSGQKLTIDASSSFDPDGDNLSFRWWVYSECSSSEIILSNSNTSILSAEIPLSASDGQVHIILEITDEGQPKMTSYRRVILHVKSKQI